ncbi:MAG: phosphate ABC transporter substrate-binding protein [candidate division WOR-3 bacterium]
MRLAYYLFPLLVLTIDCRPNTANAITIVGSTSVQPFVEKLAEEYMKLHPRIKINVQGGGSTAGITAVMDGACPIGMSSRHLKNEEKGLDTVTIAQDAIVVIVHPQNNLRNITLQQIRDIFSGKIKRWKELGGEDAKIVVVTREEGSGTRGAFTEMVMEDSDISGEALVQDSNGAVREIVARDKYAIGYISFGLLDERVQPLAIGGVLPTVENIKKGVYGLKRPFLLLVKPGSNCALADSFIGYCLSREGQKSLSEEGLIPRQP